MVPGSASMTSLRTNTGLMPKAARSRMTHLRHAWREAIKRPAERVVAAMILRQKNH